ncbi:YfiR family protein [Methylomonas rivi]|uniref:YfiR family protein n=1 Tax=Methylomonas rivi TaxID=2952226 RepID=A0ABT1U009_9GAMM|nr:YfiR family protein [Methylomonas sp. WSC-6]MCQ8127148.1 YfiR family protein [Methylomonas sp. WSC-6]
MITCLLVLPGIGASQDRKHPNEVEAAFLRNFAHYVEWPSHAFADDRSSWVIGILGDDPFGDIMETTFSNRTEKGRAFKVLRADSLDEMPDCHIVFIAYKSAGRRRWALDQIKNKPVLTVGDAPEFLREGGIIQFNVDDRVHMNINLDQARAVALTIQTKMLEVSSGILEHGVIRKVR